MRRKIICALDTGDLNEALAITRRLAPHVGAFKIGHALVLPNGLDVIDRIQDAGATRIFLDLKFHDIPNTVALGVTEAAKKGVWMLTVHTTGGPAMMNAAAEAAKSFGPTRAPLLVGVSVLTSLDQSVLTNHLAVNRTIEEHMIYLSKLAIECGLDGAVCSAHEVKALRAEIGHAVIVTPGIRLATDDAHDQKRVGDARQVIQDGADYLVIGRALTSSHNPEETLQAMGLLARGSQPV